MRQANRARMHRLSAWGTAVAMVGMAAGCCSDGGENRQPEGGELARSLARVSMGMTREEVFSALPQRGFRSRLSSETLDDVTLEEWLIQEESSVAADLSRSAGAAEGLRSFYFYFVDDRFLFPTTERLTAEVRERLLQHVLDLTPTLPDS